MSIHEAKKAGESRRFKVHGLDCAEEVALLEREIGPLVGGANHLSFDVLNARMTVSAPGVPPEDILRAVARAGLRAELWREDAPPSFGKPAGERSRLYVVIASGLFLGAGFLTHLLAAGSLAAAAGHEAAHGGHAVPAISRALYALAVVAGAWRVLPRAWSALRRARPDMNLLMTVAVIGAAAIGEWFEAATVSFLFAVSLSLETWSIGRARRAVSALMQLSPPTARLIERDGGERDVPPGEVAPGARFLVKPGERIPLDGIVAHGESEVDQAPITGESTPVPKRPGDAVFAGTICGDGVLEVMCTKRASETTLAHIIRMVEDAQSRRAPSEQWVDRFARVYTPAIMLLSVLTLVLPPVFFGGEWREWLYRSLVFLVIGCPCALVISTPVSVAASLASAARHGVLVKGGLYVEAPARLGAIAFDKTGTLTEGRPVVTDVVPLSGHTEAELLERAAALEARSHHPIARAVVRYTAAKGVHPKRVEDFQSEKGRGAWGRVEGKLYWLGSHRYLEERGLATREILEPLGRIARGGRTVVIVGTDAHVCGFLALTDAVRPSARETIAALRRLGIAHVAMLTGDNRETADALGREVGVDETLAELLPGDKVAAVEALLQRHGTVAMVGDGVNDAPALARSSIGVAMGAVGSDAALEAADVALMSDDLAKLPWLVRHARRTVATIQANVAFALFVKVLFVVLTLAGSGSLWAAIAADMGASLLVTLNALRLLTDG